MNTKNKISSIILYVSLLVFVSFVVYILYINQEVFYTAHDRSEFISGTPFFNRLLSKPFGLMQYVGAWLTQLFYRPAFGSGVLAAIWVLIFLVGIKAFRLKPSASALMLLPVACLLTSVVDLGYWIYISTIRGYWFSQSVGYLVMLLLLWAALCTPRKWHIVWYMLGFCIYPVLGWFALLFVLCLVVAEKPTWREFLAIVLLIFTAYIWHTQYYSNLRADAVVMAGLPRFITPSDNTPHLSYPFWALGIVSVLIPLFGKNLEKWFVPALSAAAGIVFTWALMYHDQNYIDEMRMVRYAEDDNWKEVLQIAEKNPKPTTTIVFLKNVALMNEGGLLDRSFKIGNIGYPPHNPDSVHSSFLDVASPLVYYNYGIINEGIRLNYENAIQSGFCPFYLKVLARCAQAKGDKELVERYTTLLNHLPFYGDWQPAPVSANIKSLQNCFPDEITGVENSDSYIVNIISLWYDSDCKVASEQALLYAMMRCDSRRFWAALRNFVKLHMNEAFPVHAQEAYILYMDKAPEEKRMMLPVEQAIYERYKQFWEVLGQKVKPGINLGTVAEEMREEWGDTYWYYNIFGRQYSNAVIMKHQEVQS
jgi:hypothetical protein